MRDWNCEIARRFAVYGGAEVWFHLPFPAAINLIEVNSFGLIVISRKD